MSYDFLKKLATLFLGLSLVLGVIVHHVKNQVVVIEKDLKILRMRNKDLREALHILKAEWSYLNSPKRLQTLNKNHLNLRAFKPSQILSEKALADLDQPRARVMKR